MKVIKYRFTRNHPRTLRRNTPWNLWWGDFPPEGRQAPPIHIYVLEDKLRAMYPPDDEPNP